MGKLFLKLWVFILLTSVSSFLVQTYVFRWTVEEAETRFRNERTRRSFVLIEEALRPHPQAEWATRFEALAHRIGLPARLVPLDQVAATDALEAAAVTRLRAGELHRKPLADGSGVAMYRTIEGSPFVAVLDAPAPPQPRVLGVLPPMVFTWTVESLLYAFAIALWLRLFWRDLRALVSASEAIGEGRFAVDLKLRRGSALKPLADSFTRMGRRIEGLVRSHKDLTNAVSHELKTPLARLRFALSLPPESATAADRDHLVRKMQHDVEELDTLVQEMLLYSRLERDQPELVLTAVPIDSWLPSAVEDEREAAEAADIRIPVAVAAGAIEAPCEPRYMGRAVRNLVRNALRFARSRVEVYAEASAEGFAIHVDDDGPGIPPADRERVFVPFARVDETRARDTGGSGLGLAIVQRIAEWHGGRATIADSLLGGARITIRWQAEGKAG